VKRLIALPCTIASLLIGSEAAAQTALGPQSIFDRGLTAMADAGGDNPQLDEPGEADRSYSHFMQAGLRASLVGGYRMVFRYDESPLCNEDDVGVPPDDRQKFCGYGAPVAVDLALSMAVLPPVEPFLWARFGLTGESETNTNPAMIVGVGARLYTMSDAAFKVFIEPAVGFGVEGGAGNPGYAAYEYKKDLIFHLGAGPQLDVSRGVGIFLNGGMTVGILRAINAALELQGGVQVRIP